MSHDQLPNSADADRALRQRVRAFLHQRGYGPHKALEINAEQGVVLIDGQVPTFYLRQIAVELIKRVAGVTQVVDRITVVDGPTHSQATGGPVDEQPFPAGSREHGANHPFSIREVTDASRSLVCIRRPLVAVQNESFMERATL